MRKPKIDWVEVVCLAIAFAVMAAMIIWAFPKAFAHGTDDYEFAGDTDTPHCVTWQEFVNAQPRNATHQGWRRSSVREHFGPAPSDSSGEPGAYDVWFKPRSCSNGERYTMEYVTVKAGITPAIIRLDVKCHVGPAGPDDCWN